MSLTHLHYHQNKLISKSTDSSFYSETLNEDSEILTLKIKKQFTKKYIFKKNLSKIRSSL